MYCIAHIDEVLLTTEYQMVDATNKNHMLNICKRSKKKIPYTPSNLNKQLKMDEIANTQTKLVSV